MGTTNITSKQSQHDASFVQTLLEAYYVDDMNSGMAALAAHHSVLGTWDVDIVTSQPTWSNQLNKIMGVLPGTKINFNSFYDMIHPDDLEGVKQVVATGLTVDETFKNEFRVIRPIDGEIVWIQQTGKALFNEAGHPVRVVGANLDITHLKKAEQKALDSNKAKSEFLANMSHEIRTPMNGIMGMAELLKNCDLSPRETDFVNTINRSGQALLTIINDILDFSKVEAGFMELDLAPFHLRDAIEDVTTLLSSHMEETGVDLLMRVQPDLPSTYVGDVGRFRQILTNIIGNAVKFTMEGHVLIDVSGVVDGETAGLTINIEDTGIGISSDKLDGIFEQFSQADNSTTRQFGGTGLGLSIAKNLVALMGGEISVTSELGKGSKFSFDLQMPTHKDLVKPKLDTLNIAGRNILVIDDNAVNREILKEQLSYWKCRSALASSAKIGRLALQRAQEKNIKIDLIIVDYQMPEETGEDFVRQIKNIPSFADIPIIVLSSVDKSALRLRMLDMDVANFLNKPARASALHNAIGTALFDRSLKAIEVTQSLGVSSETASTDIKNRIVSAQDTQNNHVDILIAEDNEVNQMYIKYALEGLGVSFKIVPNGRIAVDKWKLLSPKIVLMDISMPEMNGYEATMAIRALEADRKTPRTPIVAVTAHALTRDKERCLDNGMDDYLTKPLSIGALEACLEKWGIIQSGSNQMAQTTA